MIRKLVVRPIAEQEANEAFDWYEEREHGLGDWFRQALKKQIDLIRDNPLGYPVVYGSKVRHAVIGNFPYRIIFSIENESIVVFSIFHDRRNPAIWRRRSD